MIEEAHVNFETARLLKEMGFDTNKCYCVYEKLPGHNPVFCGLSPGELNCNCTFPDYRYLAPTLQMACRWIREVHHLCIEPYRTACGYLFTISRIPTGSEIYSAEYCGDDEASGQFTTYEGCVEYAIRYVLENLV